MRVHHLNCATMCPLLGRLVNESRTLICHVLLIETDASGLVLVDTGFGTDDVRDARARLGSFVTIGRPRLDLAETALHQVEALGHAADDVRHVLVTHLDLDHAGGLPDFPEAQVHLMRAEHDAAMRPRTLLEKNRYRPCHWAHGPRWSTHDPTAGERWFGFDCVRDLDGLPPEILFVPLAGHSRGHAGVAVQLDDGWLLHCGDAYFFWGEMMTPPTFSRGLSVFQTLAQVDGRQRHDNQRRLRELVSEHGDAVRVFSAHDPKELARLA